MIKNQRFSFFIGDIIQFTDENLLCFSIYNHVNNTKRYLRLFICKKKIWNPNDKMQIECLLIYHSFFVSKKLENR